MTINYPDLELTMQGKYLAELTSLFAMRYIQTTEEPVKIAQTAYKEWCEKNGLEVGAHLKQLCRDGAEIEGVIAYLKIPSDNLLQEKDNGQTWREWADSVPPGARFKRLVIRQESGFAYLRPGHNLPTAKDLQYFAGFDYVEFSA